MRDYVPIEKNRLPERFEIDLAGDTFVFQFNYNKTYDFFTVDLYDYKQNPLVIGEKLVLGVPLWSDLVSDNLPAPTLIPMDESGNTERITFDNFMVTTFLFVDDVAPTQEEPSLESDT
ncbi:phage baseplate plug family protein [Priestia filamentosa]|uniref:phage baseplate plug family protein n=1 Tax=Priestia filamentosa TaxID=1402861 RepID=UPI0039827A60